LLAHLKRGGFQSLELDIVLGLCLFKAFFAVFQIKALSLAFILKSLNFFFICRFLVGIIFVNIF